MWWAAEGWSLFLVPGGMLWVMRGFLACKARLHFT